MIYAGNANAEGRHSYFQPSLNLSEYVLAGRDLKFLQDILSRLSAEPASIGASLQQLQESAEVLRSRALEHQNAAASIQNIDVAEESVNLLRLKISESVYIATHPQANLQPMIAQKLLSSSFS